MKRMVFVAGLVVLVWGASLLLSTDAGSQPQAKGLVFLQPATPGTPQVGSFNVTGTGTIGGFRMVAGAGVGKVLTSDGTGIGTWQAPSGLTLPFSGQVGVPGGAPFSITNSNTQTANYGIVGRSLSSSGIGVFGHSGPGGGGEMLAGHPSDLLASLNPIAGYSMLAGSGYGGYFDASGAGEVGVGGAATDTTAANTGGEFFSFGPGGTGVYGEATDTSVAENFGVHGVNRSSGGAGVLGEGFRDGADGVKGVSWSSGRGVAGVSHGTGSIGMLATADGVSGFLAYGTGTAVGATISSDNAAGLIASTLSPTAPAIISHGRLSVVGQADMTGFQLITSPAAGYVLTSDASGVGTWQAPSAATLTLPFIGSATAGGPSQAVFSVTNNATVGSTYGLFGESKSDHGIGVYGICAQTTGTTFGGFFESSSFDGAGVFGRSYGDGIGVHGVSAEGINDSLGIGVQGDSYGDFGIGVLGRAHSDSGPTTGLYGVTESQTGWGVRGEGPSTGGTGVFGSAAFGGDFLGQGASGVGVRGRAASTTGNVFGGHFSSSSPTGAGVFGLNEATTGEAVGVFGQSNSSAGYGVKGFVNFGSAKGVYGVSQSATGNGVYGENTATTGTTAGVFGTSRSATGQGVYGVSVTGGTGVMGEASGGLAYGVYGKATVSAQVGVYGTVDNTTGIFTNAGRFVASGAPSAIGVYASSSGIQGRGVNGLASGVGAGTINYGGSFEAKGGKGFGVYGLASATSGANYGVYGQSDSATGFGLYGFSSGIGVYGESSNTTAVFGRTTNTGASMGGYFESATHGGGFGVKGRVTYTTGLTAGVRGESESNQGIGVQGWAIATSGVTVGVLGQSDSSVGYSFYGYGDLYVSGDITAAGTKSGYVSDIVLNAGNEVLVCGDVVEIVGYDQAVVGEIPVIRVRKAQRSNSRSVLGPVDCAVTLTPRDAPLSKVARLNYPTKQFLVHQADGPIQPGDYGRVVTLGSYKKIKVDASYGSIQPGDLLVSSKSPGYAMISDDPKVGTVIGKSLGSLDSGKGWIPVLVQSH